MTVDQAILKVNTMGHILAFAVSEEAYMREYAEQFCIMKTRFTQSSGYYEGC